MQRMRLPLQRAAKIRSKVRKRALQLYLERVQPNWQIAVDQPYHRILLGEKVRSGGQDVTIPASSGELKVVELDELHTYAGSKKRVDGYGLLLLDLANGSSVLSAATEVL